MDFLGVFNRGLTTAPGSGAINLRLPALSLLPRPPSPPSPAEKIAELEAEGRRLYSALYDNINASEAERLVQHSRYCDVVNEVEWLKVQLEEEKARRVALEETVKKLGKAKAVVEEERDWFESALGSAQRWAALLAEEKEDLAVRVGISEARVRVAEVANQKLTATLDAAQKETAEVKTQNAKLVGCVVRLAKKKNEVEAARNDLSARFEAVSVQHGELVEAARSHQKTAENNFKRLRVAHNKIYTISKSLIVSQAKIEKVEKDRKQLRAELDEERSSHAKDVADLSAAKAGLAESLSDTKAKVEELTKNCEGLRVELDAEREAGAKAVSTMTIEQAKLSACLSESHALNSQHERAIASLTTSLDGEKKKTHDLQRASRRQVAHLSNKCSGLSSTIVDLRREKATLESDLGSEVEDNGLLRDMIDPLQHEASQLQMSMAEALARYTAMEAKHTTDMAALNQALLDAQAQRDTERLALEKRLADAEAQLASERQRAASAQADLEAERKKNVELERELRVAREDAAAEKECALQVEEEHKDLWAQLQAEKEAHRSTQENLEAEKEKNGELERQLCVAREEAAAEKECALQVEEEHRDLWAQLQAEKEDRRRTEEDLEVFTSRLKEEKRSADVLRKKQSTLMEEGRCLYQRVILLQGIVNHYQEDDDSSDEDDVSDDSTLEDTAVEDIVELVAPRDAIDEVFDAAKSDVDDVKRPVIAVLDA